MLLTLIIALFVVATMAQVWTRWLGRNSFALVALAPAVAFGWALTLAPKISRGEHHTETYPWIPTLGVKLSFHIGLVQWLLMLVVTGIGALILLYCRWYFANIQTRTLGLLVAFAGAMVGLVTADDLVVLYVFWELTTVFSYLLIGHDSSRRANRAAAMTALIVTTFGGLAMLVGIVTLGLHADTFSLQTILSHPPTGAAVTVGALLMLVGALSKSALVPFHFWLPGAMAAPTPVSAYLHAATMVKAGVFLVAMLAPTFAGVPGWRVAVTLLGATTMIMGGWRALRQNDLKLLLAYGTVSQLGFITMLVGLGTKAGAQAGIAMLLAHALFKGTLFLALGVVDHSTGTRDLTKLSGVGRQLPVLAVLTGLAAASMAGLPPLFGFVAKEGALDALVKLTGGDGTGALPAPTVLLLAAVVLGSALTMAYSLRFWWGAFAPKPQVATTPVTHRPEIGFQIAPWLLGLASLVLGFLGGPLTRLLSGYVDAVPTGKQPHSLALWYGFTWPLMLSLVALGLGVLLFWFRSEVSQIQSTFPEVAAADEIYRRVMRMIDGIAVETTARTQRGSLASTLSIILSVFVLGVAGALVTRRNWPDELLVADSWAQAAVALLTCVAALNLMWVRGRVRAVLTVGATGYGTALLFLLHGAPDLALTQVLVETASVLIFLLVMRSLPKYFTDRPLHSSRWWRLLLAVAVGATVTTAIMVAASSRTHDPVSKGLETVAYEFGYGKNIVNVILVDTRAWDTLGELTVLVAAATGVAALIFLRARVTERRHGGRRRVGRDSTGGWLRGTVSLNPGSRSLIFEVTTRLLFGIMMIASIHLLIAGHNSPGGGFAGGLVAGLALVVRYLAAGAAELEEAAPIDAGRLLGAGLLVAIATALVPAFFGGRIFQSYHITIGWPDVPRVGSLHLVSSTAFDIGVYLIVVGMVLDVVRSLGAGIDQQASDQKTPLPLPDSTTAVPASARADSTGGSR
ncbi:Na+/H+ antiporter subunit A [Aestuariimicrobium ganziense]|uniref:Na+/H+ antiporter subunit A n=1 Tax=Aestuariimicrobium ganziense TaxID=2773677 RepID=UPI002E27E7B5|nr:Na+/H+ antiporter subunit A [Aestuariimicrobium ganziense]